MATTIQVTTTKTSGGKGSFKLRIKTQVKVQVQVLLPVNCHIQLDLSVLKVVGVPLGDDGFLFLTSP